MTNLERIQKMNAEEMADMVSRLKDMCKYCPAYDVCAVDSCKNNFRRWLESEVEE